MDNKDDKIMQLQKSASEDIEQDAAEGFAEQPEIEDYNQEHDADFSHVKLGGKHFCVKAPKRQTESGIVLTEGAQKQIQAVQDMPTFDPDIVVQHAAEKCEIVEVGDMVLLSPHVQALEFVLEDVLYLMIHEDYLLAAKPVSEYIEPEEEEN